MRFRPASRRIPGSLIKFSVIRACWDCHWKPEDRREVGGPRLAHSRPGWHQPVSDAINHPANSVILAKRASNNSPDEETEAYARPLDLAPDIQCISDVRVWQYTFHLCWAIPPCRWVSLATPRIPINSSPPGPQVGINRSDIPSSYRANRVQIQRRAFTLPWDPTPAEILGLKWFYPPCVAATNI